MLHTMKFFIPHTYRSYHAIRHSRLSTLGDYAFPRPGSNSWERLWSSLLQNVTSAPSLTVLRWKCFKTLIFSPSSPSSHSDFLISDTIIIHRYLLRIQTHSTAAENQPSDKTKRCFVPKPSFVTRLLTSVRIKSIDDTSKWQTQTVTVAPAVLCHHLSADPL